MIRYVLIEPPKKRSSALTGCLVLAGAVAVLMLVSVWSRSMETPGERAEGDFEIMQTIKAKRWVREHLADAEAEVMGMGPVQNIKGGRYRFIRVRGRNVFGGPVINHYIGEVVGEGFGAVSRLEDFAAEMDKRYGKEEGWLIMQTLAGL